MSIELNYIDCSLSSIKSLTLSPNVITINLHHNKISDLCDLELAPNLMHLDLSSNAITRICGVDRLLFLRTLNLSSNQIVCVEGLQNLKLLVRLDLSFNRINCLDGLKQLHGPDYHLSALQLQGNEVHTQDHVVSCCSGLVNLRQLTLFDPHNGDGNPVCQTEGYRPKILFGLPQVAILDYLDRQGYPIQLDVLADIPELTGYLDLLKENRSPPTNPCDSVSKVDKFCRPPSDQTPVPEPEDSYFETKYSKSNFQLDKPDQESITCKNNSSTEYRLTNIETQLKNLLQSKFDQIDLSQAETSNPSCSVNPKCIPVTQKEPTKQSTIDSLPNSQNSIALNLSKSVNKTVTSTHQPPEISNEQTSSRPTTSNTGKVLQEPNKYPTKKLLSHPDNNRTTKSRTNEPSKQLSGSKSKCSKMGSTINRQPVNQINLQLSQTNDTFQTKSFQQRDTSGPKLQNSDQEVGIKSQLIEKPDLCLSKTLAELAREKMTRKELEHLCQSLQKQVHQLQAAAIDEQKALEATENLKQAFSKERHDRLVTESQLQNLEAKYTQLSRTNDELRSRSEAEKLEFMEQIKQSTLKLQELQLEYLGTKTKACDLDKKVEELNLLLRKRECDYQDVVRSRFALDGPEFSTLLTSRIEAIEAQYKEKIQVLNDKILDGSNRYMALEDEFRLALHIEAERYNEVFNLSEHLKNSLNETQTQLKEVIDREQSARQLISNLTAVVKEQKSKAITQQKANLLIQHNQKEQIATLQAHLDEARSRLMNMENCRKEVKQLKAELAAQESLIAVLRAEQRNWSEELAKQGSSLAQDRGRLEAKIETQELEIASLKKALESEVDTVKIKSKIIDDQIDTIRTLKNKNNDHQTELKQLQTEVANSRKDLENQRKINEELSNKVDRLVERKEELKATVEDLQLKIEELEREKLNLSNRWTERTSLLEKLESQVDIMRSNWEKEQKQLIDERDNAKDQVNELLNKMKRMDSSFRQQLLTLEQSKNATLTKAQEEMQTLKSACDTRVAEVEQEMRILLCETEQAKRSMKTRMKFLSLALCDTTDPNACISNSQLVNQPENLTADCSSRAFHNFYPQNQTNTDHPMYISSL